jgi:thioredoxin 1
MIPEIDAQHFDAEVTQSERPVLVDFFTTICEPCRLMLPRVEEIAQERATDLKVVKFNAEANPAFAARFRISSVPNFILFQRGVPVGQRTGSASKKELIAWIDSTLR